MPVYQLERRNRILRGPFQPAMNLFPRTQYGNNLRSINASWYNEHNWLEYSPKIDKAFCFPCRMFHSSSGLNMGQIDKTFSLTSFKNWNNTTTKFRNHQASKSHFNSNQAKANFLNCKSIDVLDESKTLYLNQKENLRLHNRSIFYRLIDVTLCVAKSGKPFRGHIETDDHVSEGLFLDVIDILKKYDDTLKNHLDKGPQNASNIIIQNDILLSINNVITRTISTKVSDCLVSIMADETSDVGHHE